MVVLIPLLVLCLCHWGLLYHGIIIVRATWNPTVGACVVNQTDSAVLKFTFFASAFIYEASCCTHDLELIVFLAMGFDLVILVVTCAALLSNSSRSGLWQLLFRDGLIYWGVTFSVNAIPAVSS